MAKFNITKDSVKLIGDNKTGMEVTFIADDGREVTQNHEVESVDMAEIERQLQLSADEFESREVKEVELPKLQTNKDVSIDLSPVEQVVEPTEEIL